MPELAKYLNSDISVLKSTVNLSYEKLRTYNKYHNNYGKFVKSTNEPAEPFSEEELKQYLS